MTAIQFTILSVTVLLVLRDTTRVFATSAAERYRDAVHFVCFAIGALLFAGVLNECSAPTQAVKAVASTCKDTVAPAIQLWPSMYTPVADDVTVTPIHRKH